jgi:hypothetical protein
MSNLAICTLIGIIYGAAYGWWSKGKKWGGYDILWGIAVGILLIVLDFVFGAE